MTATVTKHKAVGRPKTPKDVADQQASNRVAALAFQILSCLRQSDHALYESERMLRGWLQDADVQFSSGDVAPALGLLESVGLIGRAPEKGNSPRSGWLVGAVDKPVWTSGADTSPEPVNGAQSVSEPVIASVVSEPAEPAPELPGGALELVSEGIDDDRINALARAIVAALHVSGRAHQGNRFLCESEAVLRQYLIEDGVRFDDLTLAAALRVLETASLSGSDARLIRGTELHRMVNRSVHTRATPLPARAMLLSQIHAFDFREYEFADIEPYLLPVGAE